MFEDSLIESGNRLRTKRGRTTTISFILEAIVIGVLVLIPLLFTEALPKTRSGKIMRRLLKELAAGGEVKGDTTTLEDFSVIAKLKEQEEA